MPSIPSSLQEDRNRLRHSFRLATAFAALLWIIKIVEMMFHLELVRYGVFPLQASGLMGILMGFLIHGSWSHLFANTLPIIILGTALLYGYPRSAKLVLAAVWLGSGLGVWLFAREAYHIGASGLTFGVMFFLFMIGILRWDKRAIALSMIIFFLYGSMIWGIFPLKPGISFESHFFGAVIGVVLAIVLRNHDPAPLEKKYSWEDETVEEIEETGDSAHPEQTNAPGSARNSN